MTHSSSTPVVPHANLGALDEHLHEDCPGECHRSTCPQRGALPMKPRCEEKLQAAGDVPPDPWGHGPTMSHTDNKDIIELVKLGEAHLQSAMDICSILKAKIGKDQLQVPVLDVTSPGEFDLAVSAVLDIAVSPTSPELRPPVLHPRQASPFWSQSQVMDAKERRNKRDRDRYARMTNEERQEKLKKRREAYKKTKN